MVIANGTVQLRRPIGARLASGWTFQVFLTLAVVVNLALVAVVVYFTGPGAFLELAAAIPIYAIWAFGLTASARADGDGVSWRYFLPRRFSWDQISGIELGRQGHPGTGDWGSPAVIVLESGRHRIVRPALGVSKSALKEFVEGLSEQAAPHGVEPYVTGNDQFWKELLAGDLTGQSRPARVSAELTTATAPTAFELHRTRWMRLGGGPSLQPVFLLWLVISIIVAIPHELMLLIISAVLLALCIAGATARVRVDDVGIHRRCYLPHTDLWGDIRWVELHTLQLGSNGARRVIRIHRAHGRHLLAPATGNGGQTEQFGRTLIAAARARGIKVTGSGWGGFAE